MAITGFPQSSNNGGNAANVGDLSQLPTNNQSSVVNSIIELDANIKSIPFLHVQNIVLTPVDIINASVMLDFIPASNSVELSVIGGILQKENIDFMVIGQQLSWETLALELLVSAGSILHLSYIRG